MTRLIDDGNIQSLYKKNDTNRFLGLTVLEMKKFVVKFVNKEKVSICHL